jgi:DNA ligase-1
MSSNWIRKLNESNSKLHKEDVFKQALSFATLGDNNSHRFLTLVNYCYNPMITFGVKQISETVGITDAENPWTEFQSLLDSLRNRELTGNAARDAIDAMSLRFDSDEWNEFCVAVIRKDLRINCSEKTINKVCKKTDYEIPIFSCQLATSCEDRPQMKGEMRLEPKLDGVRVLMWCAYDKSNDATAVVAYSRNGKVFDNFGHIESQISNQLKHISKITGYNSFFLDGEVVGKSFNELMRVARKKDGVAATDSVFHIFDFIPHVNFKEGHWNDQLHKRLSVLDKMKRFIDKMPSVEYPDHLIVNLDTSQGRNQMERYAKDCVNDGYEGIMIKSMEAPYECKRSTFWMKWKPVITVDLQIVQVEQGTGKNSQRMGAFVCEGIDDGKFISVNVGSGVSDEERESYWDNRESLIGRTVEILCDSVSQNQDSTYSLRFPRFVRFRDDK